MNEMNLGPAVIDAACIWAKPRPPLTPALVLRDPGVPHGHRGAFAALLLASAPEASLLATVGREVVPAELRAERAGVIS